MTTRTIKTCSVPGCGATDEHATRQTGGYLTRGLCGKHYLRWLKYGTTDPGALKKSAHHANPACTVADCGKPTIAKGLCTLHYQREKRGVPLDAVLRYERGLPLAQRILRYVEEVGDCWVWQGACDPAGYGQMNVRNRILGAHRISYEAFMGTIPEGLHIDHICRNPPCVNPAHLRPVTNAENVRRSYLSPEEHAAL